jgi:Uri superfamily endonuclease
MNEYAVKQEARRARILKRRQPEERRGCDVSLRSGCYSLIIELKRKKTIRVGKLGEAVFPAGTYVYTGIAMSGLGARLKRHCNRKKKIHWHIDYLLTLPSARVRQIALYPATPGQECRQNKRIAGRPGAVAILKDFGASDCKSGCSSHLFFSPKISCRNSPSTVTSCFDPNLSCSGEARK